MNKAEHKVEVVDDTLRISTFISTPEEKKYNAEMYFTIDRATGEVMLNREYEYFNEFLKVTRAYLGAGETERVQMEARIKSSILKDLVGVLKKIVEHRKVLEDIRTIGKQRAKLFATAYETKVVEELQKEYTGAAEQFLFDAVYTFGRIQGIRDERARRNKKVIA